MEITCPVTETYQDVEKMIHKVVHAFLRKKNLFKAEYEEWHAEACMAFSNAFQSFDRRLGNRFTTWLWWCIWNALSDKLQREAPHWTTSRLDDNTAANLVDNRCRVDAGSSLDLRLLTQDTQTVIKIVFGTYGHVDGKEEKPEEIRLALYNLLCSMGWSAQRVFESFHEIRTVLTK